MIVGYAAALTTAFIGQTVRYTLLGCICSGLIVTFIYYAIAAKRV